MAQTITIQDIEYALYRDRETGEQVVLDPCWKCGGTGVIPHFYHVHDGVCFACLGTKGTYRTPEKQEALIKRRAADRARRARKADAKAAALRAKIEAFAIAHPDLAFMADADAIFGEDTEMHHILRDMGAKLHRFGSLSERQVEFARRIQQEQQEKMVQREYERANSKPAPSGRVRVEGKIIKAVMQEVQAGPYATEWKTKITVKHEDGWVANGWCPSGLYLPVMESKGGRGADETPEDYLPGAMVAFTATLEVKEEGGTFAFFKRPIKPEVIQDEEEVDPIDLQDEAAGNMTPGSEY